MLNYGHDRRLRGQPKLTGHRWRGLRCLGRLVWIPKNAIAKFTLGERRRGGNVRRKRASAFLNAKIPILLSAQFCPADYHSTSGYSSKIKFLNGRYCRLWAGWRRARVDLPERRAFVAISGNGGRSCPRARSHSGTIGIWIECRRLPDWGVHALACRREERGASSWANYGEIR